MQATKEIVRNEKIVLYFPSKSYRKFLYLEDNNTILN